jgi:flavin reductase (DIM6/NTAB) family NADH-FMN oxidoreductase RutF
VDCDIKSIHEEGDHDIVIGLLRALRLEDEALPLVFFRGGYGRFSAISIAVREGDLAFSYGRPTSRARKWRKWPRT